MRLLRRRCVASSRVSCANEPATVSIARAPIGGAMQRTRALQIAQTSPKHGRAIPRHESCQTTANTNEGCDLERALRVLKGQLTWTVARPGAASGPPGTNARAKGPRRTARADAAAIARTAGARDEWHPRSDCFRPPRASTRSRTGRWRAQSGPTSCGAVEDAVKRAAPRNVIGTEGPWQRAT